MNKIDLLSVLHDDLLSVVRPGRYLGGEYGAVNKDANFNIAVAFADLYEIGMSNQAMQLLYNYFNAAEGVSAQRVFAVAEDYEQLLKSKNIPLYSLESYSPIKEFDVVAFTIGYELAFTNVLAMLELAGIPLRAKDRKEGDPLIIAGGPAVVNPLPWSTFFDAIYIGEVEEPGLGFIENLATMKKNGAGRAEILSAITALPAIWTPHKKAVRATWAGFGKQPAPLPVVPSVEVAQGHGVVEIMRGCPNSCRFCLAGTYYKPFRCKEIDVILKEVDALVTQRGLREISLNSLSSADFPQIKELLQALNRRYKDRHISFGLPSLRVNGFGLGLLKELSTTRKSGLTFAVETPYDRGQASLNKPVEEAHILDILHESAKEGWRKAKFYFMVGLPVYDNDVNEAEAIAHYILNLQKQTNFEFNVNVGIFIPKAHTPYERAAQLTEEASRIYYHTLKELIGRNRKIKLSFHSPFFAEVEGLLARGDERAGEIAFAAYQAGARFDAWEELAKQDIWRTTLADADYDVMHEIHREHSQTEQLPWHSVMFRLSPSFLPSEKVKSDEGLTNGACDRFPCTSDDGGPDSPCGACSSKVHVVKNSPFVDDYQVVEMPPIEVFQQIIFCFTKEGKGRYLSHLNLVAIFEKAIQRAGLPIRYSQGFNPKPCLDVASPLSLGIESLGEIASIELNGEGFKGEHFVDQLNKQLPQGLKIIGAKALDPLPYGRKYKNLMAQYGGATFAISGYNPEDLQIKILDALQEGGATMESFSFKQQEMSLLLTIKQSGGKLENVAKIMERVLGANPLTSTSGCSIKRVKLWKKDEGKLTDYI